MTRTLSFALCAALLLAVASGAALTESLSTSAFSAPPGKVFDGTPSTGVDKTTWGTYTNAMFGPGSTNSTVFAYGYAVPTAATSITAVASRTLNATLLSNGTADTTEYAVIGSDAIYSTAITTQSAPVAAVGLGTFALAYAALDSSSCSQVYVSIFTGGTASPTVTKAITSNTCSHCTVSTASTGVGYANIVNNIFYESSTFYVSYTTTVYTETATTSTTSGCTSGTTYPSAVSTGASNTPVVNGQVLSYLQGVSTSGTLKWTAAATIYTGTASTAGAAPSPLASAILASCGQGNYTNSTTLLCAYTVTTTTSYVPVTVSTGTAGSATTIATSTVLATTPSYPTTINTYTVAGFVHSQYQQGILLNNQAAAYTATSTYTAVNTLQLYNLTSGASSTTGATAGGIAITGISNTYSGGQYSGIGGIAELGYAIIDNYATASGAYASEYSTWFANGTANVTKVTIATGAVSVAPSVFVDANGALWVGAYSLDTTATPNTLSTGYLGKLSAQVYSASSMARIVTCFFFGLIISFVALLVF